MALEIGEVVCGGYVPYSLDDLALGEWCEGLFPGSPVGEYVRIGRRIVDLSVVLKGLPWVGWAGLLCPGGGLAFLFGRFGERDFECADLVECCGAGCDVSFAVETSDGLDSEFPQSEHRPKCGCDASCHCRVEWVGLVEVVKDGGQIVDCYQLSGRFRGFGWGGNSGGAQGGVDGGLVDLPGDIVDDVPGADPTDVVADGGAGKTAGHG